VILLHAHCALWLELAPEKLSLKARARIRKVESSGEALAHSCMSLWEIACRHAGKQLESPQLRAHLGPHQIQKEHQVQQTLNQRRRHLLLT